MSERYGTCKSCRGFGSRTVDDELLECGMCGGTGFSGDVMDLLDSSNALKLYRKRDTQRDSQQESNSYEIAIQTFLNFFEQYSKRR